MSGLAERIQGLLDEIQNSLFNKAKDFMNSRMFEVNNWEEFLDVINVKQGFAIAHWDGTGETEEKIKEMTKATIRCIPLNNTLEDGICVLTGNPSKQRVIFAKSY
jgi:prolyl-tRNA synthetase